MKRTSGRKIVKFGALVLCLAMMLSFGVGCSSGSDEIVFAFVGPLTGDFAEYGQSMKAAAQIAIDEWNANGGVLGKQISLVEFDDANSSEQAASVAERIVGDDSIVAVIGHFSSGVAMTAAEIYQEAGIALVNGTAAHIDFAKIGDGIFRNNAMYTTDANSMLQMLEHFEFERFGLLNPNSDAGISNSTEVESMYTQYKAVDYAPELVLSELYEDGTVDFSATVAKFIEADVDVIYSSGAYAQLAPFIQQYKERDPEIEIIGTGAVFSEEFLALAGDAAEGVLIETSFFYGSEDPEVKAFSEKFMEAYGANPSTFAGQVYDGTNAILHAIVKGESAERADIVTNLATTDFQGVTGKITFDEEGNTPKQQVVIEIRDGEYHEIPGVLLSRPDWEAARGF